MYTLKLLEGANKEFLEAAIWYEKRSVGLGDRFIDTIHRKLEIIQGNPKRYPKRKGNFRETPVKIFPYIIIYSVYKKEKIITINSIFHGSRNPRKKYRKK